MTNMPADRAEGSRTLGVDAASILTVAFAVLVAAAALAVLGLGAPAFDRAPAAPGEVDRAPWRVIVLPAAVAAMGVLAVVWGRGPAVRGGLRDAAILCGITAGGLLARLPVLPIGVWRDESSTYFDSLPATTSSLIELIRFSELNPPAYYLVMQWWIDLAGADGVVFKAPSLVFGLLLIPACYALGRAAGSPLGGLIAAFLVAISPEAIYYSQEARPYAMAAVLSALTAVFALRSLDGARTADLAGLALSAAALLYTHYTGLMLVGALAGIVGLLCWRRRDGRTTTRIAAALAVAAALYLPWLETFLFHLGTGTPWTPEASWSSRPEFLVKNIAYTLPWTGGKWLVGPPALLVLAAMAAGVWALLAERAPTRGAGPTVGEAGAVLIVAVAAPAIALAVLAYPSRYMFLFTPIACALYGLWIGAAIERRSAAARRHLLPVGLGVVFAWAALFAWSHAQMGTEPKSGIRTIAARADDETLRSTAYLLAPDYLAPTFAYEFRGRDVTFLAFARAEDPHLFSPIGYAEIWAAPDALRRTQNRIAALAADGFHQLAFLQANCGEPAQDRGRMLYSRANDLRAWLDETYPSVGSELHPGLSECVRVTTYDLLDGAGAS